MGDHLVDTSVFIAAEQGRLIDASAPSGDVRISVATVTELRLGVARSRSDPIRELRERTLGVARRFIALPYDEAVAERLALLVAAARDAGRRVGLMDAIIAATALVHELTVWSLDEDFEVLAALEPELRIEA